MAIAVTATDLAPARPRTRPRWRIWLQYGVPVVVFAVLAVRFGPAPFLDAFRTANPWTFLAAVGIAVGTTACCVARWRVVAAALGLPLSFREAMAAYYRSQFLNATLPGGVVGDVDRGLGQHREGRPLGGALRGIAWERMLGQGVQVLLTATVVAIVPSPLRRALPSGTAAVAGGALAMIAVVLLAVRPSWRRLVGRKSGVGSDKPDPMSLQGETHPICPGSCGSSGRRSCAGSDRSNPMSLQGGTHARYMHDGEFDPWSGAGTRSRRIGMRSAQHRTHWS